MFILDSHCDTPSQILRLRDLSLDNGHAQIDIPKLKKGGVDASFFALYTPAYMDSDAACRKALELLSAVYDTVEANRNSLALALTPAQALANKEKGLISIFIGMENGAPIGKSLALLRMFFRMGVRYMTLAHSADNEICDSCSTERKRWHGLSPFGREVISEMNRLGMLIDVSHISDESFYDVLECSSRPVVATHSCCRALADHPRNMTDDMLRALADNGGVIQINFYPVFLDSAFGRVLEDSGIMERGESIEARFIADPSDPVRRAAWYAVQDELQALPRPSYKKIVDHIDHAVSIAGIDHVGIGSDFDGIEVTPSGMEDVSCIGKIFEEMKSRGYSSSEIEKVAGGNFMRVLGETVVNQ